MKNIRHFIILGAFLTMFVLFGLTNIKVYASTSYSDSVNKSIDGWVKSCGSDKPLLRDYSQYYVILEQESDCLVVFYSSSSMTLLQRGQYGIRNISPQPYRDIYYKTYSRADEQGPYNFSVSDSDIKQQIKYSNFDIKNYDGTVFFSAPIVKIPVLPQKVSTTAIGGTLSQVTGLVPLLVVLVAGFLGLRKALQMLFQVLHKA